MKNVRGYMAVIFFVFVFSANALANEGYAMVIAVKQVQIKIGKVKTTEKGASGAGAVTGSIVGGGASYLIYGTPIGVLIGLGAGALIGNSLENGIRDKKVTADSKESIVPGYFVQLSNRKSFLSIQPY